MLDQVFKLKLGLCNNLEDWKWVGVGREIQQGGDICTSMFNSYWCMTEIKPLLQTNHQSIENKCLKKPINGQSKYYVATRSEHIKKNAITCLLQLIFECFLFKIHLNIMKVEQGDDNLLFTILLQISPQRTKKKLLNLSESKGISLYLHSSLVIFSYWNSCLAQWKRIIF